MPSLSGSCFEDESHEPLEFWPPLPYEFRVVDSVEVSWIWGNTTLKVGLIYCVTIVFLLMDWTKMPICKLKAIISSSYVANAGLIISLREKKTLSSR